jgi:hypothetical protein
MCSTAARLIAYVVAVALFAILGIAPVESIARHRRDGTCGHGRMARGLRSASAFAVSQFDSCNKTKTYETFRHLQGGRKGIFRWADADRKPLAEFDVYRRGAELNQAGPAIAEIALGWTRSARELKAKLITRAELRRPDCAPPSAPALWTDWGPATTARVCAARHDGYIAARHWFSCNFYAEERIM